MLNRPSLHSANPALFSCLASPWQSGMISCRGSPCQPAGAAFQRPSQRQPGRSPGRRSVSVSAGLLDLRQPQRLADFELLRGGGGGSGTISIATDAEGEELKQWMLARGLPPQKVRRHLCAALARAC